MASNDELRNAYFCIAACIEEAYSLVRRARSATKADDRKSQKKVADEAAHYASGLRTRLTEASSLVNDQFFSDINSQLHVEQCSLQRTFNFARKVNAELLHLLWKSASVNDKALDNGKLIRAYFDEIADDFLKACDFNKDKSLRSLAEELEVVLKD